MDKPKCFGDFAGKTCRSDHTKCPVEILCLDYYNVMNGDCPMECKFKPSCDVRRQHVHQIFHAIEPIEKCDWYQDKEQLRRLSK
jgi:hypothetical protein